MNTWQDISTAPYGLIVEIKVKGKPMRARLLRDYSMTHDEIPCDQWMAELGERYPKCWSGGLCWKSNENEAMSAQPTAWRRLGFGA